MTITELLTQSGVPFTTEGHHKNVREGWLGTNCPYCGDQSFKLGFSLNGSGCHCWGCGPHPRRQALGRLLGCPESQVPWLSDDRDHLSKDRKAHSQAFQPAVTAVSLPPMTVPLRGIHRQYLLNRNFNPDQLVKQWKIQATCHSAPDWAWRIIIPFFDKRQVMITLQGRDITDRSPMRYRSLEDALSIVPIKRSLYGAWCAPTDRVVIVEGPTKVWRLGPGAVGTSGASVTAEQIAQLRQWPNRFILFDADSPGKKAAQALAAELSVTGGHTEIISLPAADEATYDPGNWSPEQAAKLMAYLGF